MARSFACSVSDRVSCGAGQLYGGYGTMFGHLVAWFYRDNGILSIGGGITKIIVRNSMLFSPTAVFSPLASDFRSLIFYMHPAFRV